MYKNEHLNTGVINERNTLVQQVQRWGNSASLTLLDHNCLFFSVQDLEGIIGYRHVGNSFVAFGDPVCSAANMQAITQSFHDYAKLHRKNIIYIAASESFVNWSLPRYCKIGIEIGVEFILNPMSNPRAATGQKASMLRNKYNQAVRDGVHTQEYVEFDESLEKAIEHVGALWLHNRTGPQIYLYSVNVFAHRSTKRWFYARHNDKIVGVLIINRMDAQQGWAINLLMTTPDAPTTTSEFIVLHALDVLRNESCQFLAVGTNPTTELQRVEGLSPLMTWLTKQGFNVAKRIFKLGERQRYWKKFQPLTKRSFLLCVNSTIKISDIVSIMRALHVKV